MVKDKKYKLDGIRLSQIRKEKGMTQSELGHALDLSRRSIQRMEASTDGEIKLSHKEFGALTQALQKGPHQFWGELIHFPDIYGYEITDAQMFEILVRDNENCKSVNISYFPNDAQIEESLIKLAEISEKYRRKHRTLEEFLKHSEQLKEKSLLREIFRTCTHSNRTDKVKVFVFPIVKLYETFDEKEGTFGTKWVNNYRMDIVNAKTKELVIRSVNLIEYLNDSSPVDFDEDEFEELALSSRILTPSEKEDPELLFDHIREEYSYDEVIEFNEEDE